MGILKLQVLLVSAAGILTGSKGLKEKCYAENILQSSFSICQIKNHAFDPKHCNTKIFNCSLYPFLLLRHSPL
jgi:hypothetical protein